MAAFSSLRKRCHKALEAAVTTTHDKERIALPIVGKTNVKQAKRAGITAAGTDAAGAVLSAYGGYEVLALALLLCLFVIAVFVAVALFNATDEGTPRTVQIAAPMSASSTGVPTTSPSADPQQLPASLQPSMLVSSVVAEDGKLLEEAVLTAVREFVRDPEHYGILVGRGFSELPDKGWRNADGYRLKYELDNSTGDLFIINCSQSIVHGNVVAEFVRQTGNFVVGHGLDSYLGTSSSSDGEHADKKTNQPDVLLYHLPDTIGIQASSLIVEIEYHHRSGPELMQLLAGYMAGGGVTYVMGVKIYDRDEAGTWACAVVLWERVDATAAARPKARLVCAWSIGTRHVQTQQRRVFLDGLAGVLLSEEAGTDMAHRPDGNLEIVLPVENVLARHADRTVALESQAREVISRELVYGHQPHTLTLLLHRVRQIIERTLPAQSPDHVAIEESSAGGPAKRRRAQFETDKK